MITAREVGTCEAGNVAGTRLAAPNAEARRNQNLSAGCTKRLFLVAIVALLVVSAIPTATYAGASGVVEVVFGEFSGVFGRSLEKFDEASQKARETCRRSPFSTFDPEQPDAFWF